MENNGSFCSSSPGQRDSPRQSLWLQTTLSELDKKMKAMMTLLEEGNNSSVQGIEIYDNRKPELIQMLAEFNKSYRCLAEQHDQLRSKSNRVLHSGSWSSSSSTSRKKIRESSYNHRRARTFDVPKLEASDCHSDSVVQDSDVKCSTGHIYFESLNKLADELMSDEASMTNFKATEIRDDEMDKEATEILNNKDMKINNSGSEFGEAMTRYFVIGDSGWEKAWPELSFQVSKLLEENLRQLAELLKRNEEKRKIISELQAQLEHSKSENRALQSYLSSPDDDIKRYQFQRSRSRGFSFSKFFKAGCS